MRIWAVPLALAGLTLGGLLAALLIDSTLARVFAWAALALPLGAVARGLMR